MLNEKRVVPAFTLTNYQKKVMAKIIAAPTPKIAGEEITKDPQLVRARNVLLKISPSLISFVRGKATVTPTGLKIMKDENLVDDQGNLTDEGENFAYDEEDLKDTETDKEILTQSFSLIKDINILAESKTKR